ncbi:MAG TPA: hypothetical protein VJ697_12970 [Nitrososphaeraceae archaeon]|nr:hypothetical protein [Nitrososphaeraceae archaeon]
MWSKIFSDAFSDFNPVWELNHLFSGNSKDILEIRIHLALVNNSHITFGSIRPELKTLLYYIYDRDLCSYELNTGDKMQDIINVIKLISYLKQVVCEDGYRIKRLITENSYCLGNCYSTNILPKLPKRAKRSIQKKIAYTPKKRRVLLHDEFK